MSFFARLVRIRPSNALKSLAAAILLGFVPATFAVDMLGYLPPAPGNQWSYVGSTAATMTNSFGSQTVLPTSVLAIPWTRVSSVLKGDGITYNTSDTSGFRVHQEVTNGVYVAGYGDQTTTVTYSPPRLILPADASIGSSYSSTGTATLKFADLATITLNYSASTQVVGFETVANRAGTQSWSALKAISSITLSGTVGGQLITDSSTSAYWLVDGFGIVRGEMPNAAGATETWQLASSTVVTTTGGSTTTTSSTSTTTLPSGQSLPLNLGAGWSQIGNSYMTVIQVANFFDDTSRVNTVWAWNATTGKWSFYAPVLAGPALADYAASKDYEVLSSVQAGEGFWINAKQPLSVSLPMATVVSSTSFQPGSSTALRQGWSMIAIGNTRTPNEFNADLSLVPPVAGVIPLNTTSIWTWDNSLSAWYFYAPSLFAQGSATLLNYIDSRGYLDFAAAGKTLGPGTGFWVNRP